MYACAHFDTLIDMSTKAMAYISEDLSVVHTCTCIYTHTHTHRTNMTNTWYKLFNIISTHKKRTCILSCSVRSLTITHAGTYFARNDNNYTTLLISPFNTSQSLQQTETKKKKKTTTIVITVFNRTQSA